MNADDPAQMCSEHDDDEIEILEVVGIEDDDAPPAGADGDDVEVPADDDEVVVVFDEPDRSPASHLREVPDSADSDLDRLRRLHADFDNYKKRAEREKEGIANYSNGELVATLLPVLDNFERALMAPGTDDDRGFRDGVALIHRQLVEELRKHGLCAVEAIGEMFDPNRHEAVATESNPDFAPNTVVEEFQRGYYFKDRLLRPALVRVCVSDADPEDGPETES